VTAMPASNMVANSIAVRMATRRARKILNIVLLLTGERRFGCLSKKAIDLTSCRNADSLRPALVGNVVELYAQSVPVNMAEDARLTVAFSPLRLRVLYLLSHLLDDSQQSSLPPAGESASRALP
jgi:hypothetical protein